MKKFLNYLIFEVYYSLKRLIPRDIQIDLRRRLVQKKLKHYTDTWPILKTAAKPPDNWKGWPDGKKFALVLTHDIESPKGLDRCYQLAEIEMKYGFRSSFNFVVGDYEVPSELRKHLQSNGFEVGVHGFHHETNLFFSKKRFKRHALSINLFLEEWQCSGFRAPSMFRNLDWIHKLNIEYDSSTFDTDPFEPQPEGVETIFPFIVQKENSHKPIVELPYTLPQDFLLFILMQEKGSAIWKKKLEWIAKNGGMALLISHPDYMTFDCTTVQDEYQVKYYKELLLYVKERYKGLYWQPLPRNITKFWLQNYASQ